LIDFHFFFLLLGLTLKYFPDKALTAWLVVLLVVYPKTRDFPRNLVIMTALAANIAVLNNTPFYPL